MSTIAAAQYIRMSSEAQTYSLENQSAAIADFANRRGFHIIKTYSDPARSGLTLAKRQSLRQLLADIASGNNAFRAVLVYDVSRWGRFQDVDESAHYEFLCKSTGITVIYCAESFENNGSLPSILMKTLKRCMAAEFSRELGVRVYEGKRRITELGFNVGGRTPFGLRRRIASEDPARCRTLEAGERKYDRSEHLILVPGPAHEVECIREIFRGVLDRGMTAKEIARELNTRGMTLRKRRWTQELVKYVIRNTLYTGSSIWARSSQRLGSHRMPTPSDQWALKTKSFPAIVAPSDFDLAQLLMRLEKGRVFWTRDRLLQAAVKVLHEKGNLSYAAFENTPGVPKSGVVREFGLPELCAELDYELPKRFAKAAFSIKAIFSLHDELIRSLCARFPDELTISPHRWPRLILDKQIPVSLIVCRHLETIRGERWRINPVLRDRDNVALLCCLNSENEAPQSFFAFPHIWFSGRRQFGVRTLWFASALPVLDLSQLCAVLRLAALARKMA
jgi:DNA invertase Pin-like site-specific DNA recombinase